MKNTEINSNNNSNDNIISSLIKILIESNKQNKDIILSELNSNYNMLKNSIDDLKNDIQNIQQEIKKNKNKENKYSNEAKKEKIDDKSNNIKSHILNYKEPTTFENLSEYKIETSLKKEDFVYYNNSFTVFNSLNNITYLIYIGKNNNSLISYDLKDNKKITEIKNAHSKFITQIKHYLDNIKKRDILISISYEGDDAKIWDVNNFQCILKFNKASQIYFLKDNNENYILNKEYYNSSIKVYDFKGLYKKTITGGRHIETYYDISQSKNYIIYESDNNIISYDFKTNIIYHNYDNNENKERIDYSNFIVNYFDNRIIKLIALNRDDNQLEIWNFHSGNLILKTKIEPRIDSICSWNKNYIFVVYGQNIKLINLTNGMSCLNFRGHEKQIITLQKINHQNFGDCLISQGSGNDFIKLWKIK